MTKLSPKYQLLAEAIEAKVGDKLTRVLNVTGALTYELTSAELVECCRCLRDADDLKFEMLMDVCGVDYLEYGQTEWDTAKATESGFSRGVYGGGGDAGKPHHLGGVGYMPRGRFAVVYQLLSITRNHRIQLKTFCEDDEYPIVDSVMPIWDCANWFEREAFDLFGILFRGHPDLRRILTDYGFIGHPFRKDFPLIGNVEMRYDPDKGRVVYEPVTIEPRTLVPKVIRVDNRYESQPKGKGSDSA